MSLLIILGRLSAVTVDRESSISELIFERVRLDSRYSMPDARYLLYGETVRREVRKSLRIVRKRGGSEKNSRPQEGIEFS